MSKVSVDRELLERACMRPGRESLAVNDRDIIERGRAQAEIRELLAQPAEADGVEVVGFLYKNNGQALTAADMDADTFALMARSDFDGDVEKLVRQTDHIAALSAVTAERDAMQQDLKNAFSDDLKMAALREQEGEIKQLRAEVERLSAKSVPIDGMTGVHHQLGMVSVHFQTTEQLQAFVKACRAAMAAKEG